MTTTQTVDLDGLMAHYQTLKTELEQTKAQMDVIKNLIGQQLPDGGKIGEHTVAVSQGRVSWAKVAKDFPAETYPQLYSTQFDQKEAAKHIAPAVLDPYRGEVTVSIR